MTRGPLSEVEPEGAACLSKASVTGVGVVLVFADAKLRVHVVLAAPIEAAAAALLEGDLACMQRHAIGGKDEEGTPFRRIMVTVNESRCGLKVKLKQRAKLEVQMAREMRILPT